MTKPNNTQPKRQSMTKIQMEYAVNRAKDISTSRKFKLLEAIPKPEPVERPSRYWTLEERMGMIISGVAKLHTTNPSGLQHRAFFEAYDYPDKAQGDEAYQQYLKLDEVYRAKRDEVRNAEDERLKKLLDILYLSGNGQDALDALNKFSNEA